MPIRGNDVVARGIRHQQKLKEFVQTGLFMFFINSDHNEYRSVRLVLKGE